MQKPQGRKSKVAIIGGGVAGRMLAYECAQQGTLFDLYEGSAPSASSLATGASTVKGISVARQELFACKILGHQRLRQILETLERSPYLSKRRALFAQGVLEVCRTRQDFVKQTVRTYHRGYRGFFAETTRFHGPEPGQASPLFYSTRYYCDDFVFRPRAFLRALKEDALGRAGGRSRWWREHGELSLDPLSVSGRRGYSHVVLAPGAQLEKMLRALGYAARAPLRLTEGWGSMVETAYPWHLWRSFAQEGGGEADVFAQLSADLCGLKRGAQALRMDAGTVFVGRQSRHGRAAAFRGFGIDAVALERASVVDYQGTRLTLPGRKPVMGALPGTGNRVWLCGGLHKSGYVLAPMLARVLLERMLGTCGDGGGAGLGATGTGSWFLSPRELFAPPSLARAPCAASREPSSLEGKH